MTTILESSPFRELQREARAAALQKKVSEAAVVLQTRGLRPTVARVRAILGGSPNDIAPALKAWASQSNEPMQADTIPVPLQIADLARELWRRATAMATLQIKQDPEAKAGAIASNEVQAIREQISILREQYARSEHAHGELETRATYQEASLREALAQLRESEDRERKLLRKLGATRQIAAELQAQIEGLKRRLAHAAALKPRLRVGHSAKRSRKTVRILPPGAQSKRV